MNAILTENNSLFTDGPNMAEQYRRQVELMYLKSYVTWLTMQEKTVLVSNKKSAIQYRRKFR